MKLQEINRKLIIIELLAQAGASISQANSIGNFNLFVCLVSEVH